MMKEDLILL